MYKLPYFTENDPDKVMDFMKANAFITLIGNANWQSVATQIPVLIEERDNRLFLLGHIMRNTDHYRTYVTNNDVLALFQGPHCYVSSSWYTEKMGATWNYQTVHARGKIKFLSDEETMDILIKLTEKYEQEQEHPLLATDLPEGYMSTLVKAIAGFEIELSDIYPIFKLSQNRDDASYQNIVKHLKANDDADAQKIAEEMIKRRPQLF